MSVCAEWWTDELQESPEEAVFSPEETYASATELDEMCKVLCCTGNALKGWYSACEGPGKDF